MTKRSSKYRLFFSLTFTAFCQSFETRFSKVQMVLNSGAALNWIFKFWSLQIWTSVVESADYSNGRPGIISRNGQLGGCSTVRNSNFESSCSGLSKHQSLNYRTWSNQTTRIVLKLKIQFRIQQILFFQSFYHHFFWEFEKLFIYLKKCLEWLIILWSNCLSLTFNYTFY